MPDKSEELPEGWTDVSRETFGPEEFAAATNVSRETMAMFRIYAAMLEEWGSHTNLVSRASLADVWQRHFWDSAQIVPLLPETAKTLADLGSGAGFPGLVLAILLRERPGFAFSLYEATGKKARFLAAVAERLTLPVEVRNLRIEDEKPRHFDVVTARACAPLTRLLPYAQRFWKSGTAALFLKGQNVDAELTEARKSWSMSVQNHPSRSDPRGHVLEVRDLRPL
jgi:16S rRNA (guanine527-N7)-methyltransferase